MKNLTSHILLDEYLSFVNICKADPMHYFKLENRNRKTIIELGNLLLKCKLYYRFKVDNGIYVTYYLEKFNSKTLKFIVNEHTQYNYFWIFKEHEYKRNEIDFGLLNLYFVQNEYTILKEDKKHAKSFFTSVVGRLF